jgi:hypothetical protein
MELLSQLSKILDVAMQECGMDSAQLSVLTISDTTQLTISAIENTDVYEVITCLGLSGIMQVEVWKNRKGFQRYKKCTLENLIDTIMDLKSS